MKRILEIVLGAEGTFGGEQGHILQVIDALPGELYEVDVLTWENPEFEQKLAKRDVKATTVTARRIVDLRVLRLIESVIREGDYDLVHAHGHRAGMLGRLAAIRVGGSRIVWTCHLGQNKSDRNPLTRMGYRKLLRYLDARTDATIAVSTSLRDWLVSSGIDPSRVLVIPNGVDCAAYRPGPKDPALLAALGLDPGIPVVATVGRLTAQKDVRTFLAAAAEVARQTPDAQFLVVGSGPLEDALKAQAGELRVPRLVFAGERHDVPELLQSMDVLVIPSLWEGLPYVVLEAMASRVPVVCSDIEPFRSLFRDGVEALIFPAGDAFRLSSAVTRLLRDRALADSISEQGMRLVREHLSVEQATKATTDVYESVLGRDAG